MIVNDRAKRPTLSFLSHEDKDRIHQAALQILDEIGMQILHDEALELLKGAGCRVEKDNIVKIPVTLAEKSIQSAPHNISVYDRESGLTMDLGGYRSYFGPGSDLIYSLDSDKMERCLCVLEDVRRAATLCDALPNIDFIMSCAHPSDIPPHRAYLVSFQAMAENSTKPIVCTAECRHDLSEMWEIGKILRGGEEQLLSNPYFIQYAEPISPLRHPFPSLDKLLFCAEKGIPVIYSPAPIAGSTAPMTLAGHVAQGLAECFCGLVIHQLKAEGAPFIMGMGAAVLDMATGQCSYNAPEYYLAYMGMIEMSHYYDLPSWGYAGTSDSQIPDGQATYEAGLLTFLSAISGANLNHDIGYLGFGLTGSLEMIVIVDEIIGQVRRIKKGIPVEDEMLGLDAIRGVGPGGDFLTHSHTLKHLRTTQWRPNFISRVGYEKWKKSGGQSLFDRARKRLLEVLEKHEPVQISEEKTQAIQRRVDQFKK
jgi:trimethylamine--corrinoid protein Co-methyltransferase